MRLWSLHPEYLDARGLVALWREALLAQKVLDGLTRGYTHHPQLARFRASPAPRDAIAVYLRAVHAESLRRGYHFDAMKIAPATHAAAIHVTRGQIDHEWRHLHEKLRQRAPAWLANLEVDAPLRVHPLFKVVPGPVAAWEVAARA